MSAFDPYGPYCGVSPSLDLRATVHQVTRLDAQQQRLLDQLRQSNGQPVSFAQLRAHGILLLELAEYAIERVHQHGRVVGVRLLEPGGPAAGVAGSRWRRARRWPHTSWSP